MTFTPSIYRTNRRRYFGSEDMSLKIILSQLLNRSRLNPGKVYKEYLTGGLTVAFRTMHDQTAMQLSRQKPTEPSYLELATCLKAINVNDPENYPSFSMETAGNYYLLVNLADQGS